MDNSSEIAKILKDSMWSYNEIHNPKYRKITILGSDSELADLFVRVESVFSLLEKGDELFTPVLNRKGVGNRFSLTDTGEFFINTINFSLSIPCELMDKYKLNPAVCIFLGYIKKHKLGGLNLDLICYSEYACIRQKINHFAKVIKKIYAGVNFKNKLRNYFRGIKKVHDGLNEYINMIFRKYSQVKVLRMELGYRKSPEYPYGNENVVCYSEAKKHKLLFFNEKDKNSVFEGMICYIWKLEYAEQKGFSWHVVLFFHSKILKRNCVLVEEIGKYWTEHVTKGLGMYMDCKDFHNGYKTYGIGLMRKGNRNERDELRKVIDYVVKTNYFAKIKIPNNGRSIGRSKIKVLK